MAQAYIPGPMRVIWGSMGAWWVGHILNPGFFSIAVLMAFWIPVLFVELYYHLPLSKGAKTEALSPESSEPELMAQAEDVAIEKTESA
ncbi:hypothetical protein [methane-oxidizing endosymbiont of Gigantopelta aegis]|uniref:hypothetical protein n=1 Tax=methane-oxidizing endosymbiont of Gigantopelta aegis TaxID=2794938 RepID=UPI0018DD05A9|nr:hypothetical protein [methane-oxidizing endosymbiont of Gigantopelta aegis]